MNQRRNHSMVAILTGREQAVENLKVNLNESWAAVQQARREDDLVKLELFACVLAHDAKMLRQEQQATEEGIAKHE